jgi:uncharacterized protein (TIGR03000 family)
MPKVENGNSENGNQKKKKEDEDTDEEGAALKGRAKIVVKLPADAKLYFDGQLMKTRSSRRVFSTPVLSGNQVYYYILRARVVRDGQTLTQTKRILVRAGGEVRANFEDPNNRLVSTKWKKR